MSFKDILIVITSQAYIASGSAARSPSGNATVGEVGVAMMSNCSSAARCPTWQSR